MRGVVFLGDRKLALEDFPDPTPGDGEVVRGAGSRRASVQDAEQPSERDETAIVAVRIESRIHLDGKNDDRWRFRRC